MLGSVRSGVARQALCNQDRDISVVDLLTIYGLGPFLVLITLPLALGKIPPNSFYGIRLPSIMEDPALWYPVNQGVGRDMVYLGLLQSAFMLVLGLGSSRWGLSQETAVNVSVALGAVWAVVLLVRSLQWSRKVRNLRRDN